MIDNIALGRDYVSDSDKIELDNIALCRVYVSDGDER